MKAKAHDEGAQHFVFISARYSLAHTKAAARSGDAGNTDFPLGFLLGGLCGWRSKLFVQIGKSCIFVAIKDLCDEDYQV
jgi:hypothetical protein